MESPAVSTRAFCFQTLDAYATDTSPAADISTATLSPDVCVYNGPEPPFSTNSRSVSTTSSMVVSPLSDLSSIESPEVSEFVPLDEPAPVTSLLNVSPTLPTSLSISTYNTEESPADVLIDAIMETQTDESDTPRIKKNAPPDSKESQNLFSAPASDSVDPVTTDESLSSVSEFTLSDRLTMLNEFEVLLLSSEQISEFNQIFKERKIDMKEPLFQSWLSLKISSVPSEAEAIKLVLSKHTASGVPKRKAKR